MQSEFQCRHKQAGDKITNQKQKHYFGYLHPPESWQAYFLCRNKQSGQYHEWYHPQHVEKIAQDCPDIHESVEHRISVLIDYAKKKIIHDTAGYLSPAPIYPEQFVLLETYNKALEYLNP